MKNKKGFTLIELLAVIVILAIIMVIATMQINKTIKKAREDAFDLAFKNLKREIKQRIVTGDEYLCYDGDRKAESDISRNDQFFGNNFFGICGIVNPKPTKVTINGEQKEVFLTGEMRYAGAKYCQDIYDISDDYHMWVQYAPNSGVVSLHLSTTTNSKFKGVDYINGEVDKIGKNEDMTDNPTLKNENFKITYRISEQQLAGVHIKMRDEDKGFCELNQWNRYAVTEGRNSYQCQYQWNSDKIDSIINKLQTAGEAKNNKERIIKASVACKILTDEKNWKQ